MATIKDIARHAGVSKGTVDRILHNRGRYSDETAKRVRQAMKELDYKPDIRARNLSLSRKCKIAVLMPYPDQNSGYWQLPYEGMHKALDELAPSHVSAQFFHFDELAIGQFKRVAETIAKDEYDAFVAAPLLKDEFVDFFNDTFGIKPVIFFDSDLEESGREAHIGQNSLEAGHLAAKLLNQLQKKEEATTLVIAPGSKNNHIIDRIAGFEERIKGDFELIEVNDQPGDVRDKFEDIKHRLGRGISGVYVAYSSCFYIAQLIEAAGLGENVSVVGHDLVPNNVFHLQRGTIDYILTQRPIDQGYLSIRMLYQRIILGLEIPKELLMPIDIVTQENLASYLNMRDVF